MKKSCGLFVVGYVVLFAVYFWFIRQRVESPGSWFLSFFASLGFLLLISGIVGLFTGNKDRKALARSTQMRPLQNGKQIAATGIIRPSGLSTLRAPLTGEECVAYECQIRTTEEGQAVEYSSYAMTPCAVRTTNGEIRLFSFPVLDAFPWEDPAGSRLDAENVSEEQESQIWEASRRAGKEYVASTKFEEIKITRALQAFEEMFADDDGAVKKDLVRKLGDKEYTGELFQQRVVRSGAEVCAFGRYSAEKAALIGDMGMKASVNRLYPGTPEEVAKKIGTEHKVTLAFGLVFFLFTHAVLYLAYFVRPSVGPAAVVHASESEQGSQLQIAIQDKDLKKIEELLNAGVNVNAKVGDKTVLLINYNDPEIVALLLKHHADIEARDPEWDETVLFKAAREGRPEVVKMLVDAGANVNAVSRIPSKRTPLQDAIEAGRPEVEQMLRDAGAKDLRITEANGIPIASGDEMLKTYQEYIEAIYQKNVDALMKVHPISDRKGYETGDFELWQSIRVRTPESMSGYKNDQEATVRIEGKRPDGRTAVWWYQMSKNAAGQWVIDNEWEGN